MTPNKLAIYFVADMVFFCVRYGRTPVLIRVKFHARLFTGITSVSIGAQVDMFRFGHCR